MKIFACFNYAAAAEPIKEEQLTALLKWLNKTNFLDILLPGEYIAFLRASNGGDFVNGSREFQMFSVEEIPKYYSAYNFAQYMPYALPFAMDGNGNFYIFNKREKDEQVYLVSASDLGWDGEYELLAETFEDCLKKSL